MDAVSITVDILINLMSSFIVYLLARVWKSLQTKREQFSLHLQALEKIFPESQEYQWIVDRRKTYRIMGLMFLIYLFVYVATIIAVYIVVRQIILVQVQYALELLGLVAITYIGFYLGYTPITPQEVERERQINRTKTLREALGARPYGYIFQEIIFPVIIWLCLIFLVIGLILSLAFPPTIVHFPLLLVVVISGLVTIAGLHGTYFIAKKIYWSLTNLPHVPRQRHDELRQQFLQDEFEQ